MIDLVLYRPEIPQNVGALLRLSACWGVTLHCIGPFPFLFTDRHLRRAGLDYIDKSRYVIYPAFEDYYTACAHFRHLCLSTKATTLFTNMAFQDGDRLVVGSEQHGLPEKVLDLFGHSITIPMHKDCRSLNMGMSAAIVLSEALRQTDKYP